MKNEFKIREASQELLQKAVKTFPYDPLYVKITMAAYGISLPVYDEGNLRFETLEKT